MNSIFFLKKKKFFYLFFFILVLIISNLFVLKNSFSIKEKIKRSNLFNYYNVYGLNILNFIDNKFSNTFIKYDEIKINLSIKNIEKLRSDRANYLKNGLPALELMQWVPCEIFFKNELYKAKIRLKGVSDYHYGINTVRPENISYQIEIVSKGSINNMTRFSLMDPHRRGYLNNWIFREIANVEGLLKKNYEFIKLSINGKNYGAYAMDEHYVESFYNNNKIKFSPIIKFVNRAQALRQEYVNEFCCGASNFFFSSKIDSNYEENRIFDKNSIDKDYLTYVQKSSFLMKEFKNNNLKPSEIFDLNKFTTWLALSDVFGNWHGFTWGNIKLYFNPFTQKFEPIPDDSFDENQIPPTEDYRLTRFHDLFNRGYFHYLIFQDTKLRKKYLEKLSYYSNEEVINSLLNPLNDKIKKREKILNSSFAYKFNSSGIYGNAERIRKLLTPIDPIYLRSIFENEENLIEIEIANTHTLPIEILNIKNGNDILSFSKHNLKEIKIQHSEIINPKQFKDKLNFQEIFIKNKKNINKDEKPIILSFEYKIEGTSKIFSQEIQIKEYLSDQKYVNFSSFKRNGDKFLENYKGIDGSIYINEKIVISENVLFSNEYENIQFGPNSSIELINDANILSETNLIFLGNKEKPIVIGSSELSNSCFYIFSSKKISIIKNVFFQELSNCEIERLNFNLTGAVNFYDTKLILDNVIFHKNLAGDDYINIIDSKFEIEKLILKETFADALDIDFSSGFIKDIYCYECGYADDNGDGIDISFSAVEIDNFVFDKISDKALSIGEKSLVNISNFLGKNAYVCLAVKDGSNVEILKMDVDSCLYDVAVYNKKEELYSTNKLKIHQNLGNNQFFIEKNSDVIVNNKKFTNYKKDFLNFAYGS